MSSLQNLSRENVLEKLSKYRKDKRLQGFLRYKIRSQIKKLKTATRQMKIGQTPSSEMRQILKVLDITFIEFQFSCNFLYL